MRKSRSNFKELGSLTRGTFKSSRRSLPIWDFWLSTCLKPDLQCDLPGDSMSSSSR